MNEYDEDPDFPSGEWRGFYQSGGCNHRQELRLEFSAGRIRGDGIDSIGEFVISGSYDAGSREAWWTKRYLGGHNVYYKGFREIKGIWGTWEIPPYDRDGFHIWPRAQGESLAETRRAENELPVEVLVSAGPSVDKTRLA